ncbi:hypothetical protein AURDEDRAFT_166249 [Auricularia subglabra TFB-10046 SS5]|nr:hypothetical protein AURDEDRAFT_166249 [Auricularia subglabra TFB-10046 SS5]
MAILRRGHFVLFLVLASDGRIFDTLHANVPKWTEKEDCHPRQAYRIAGGPFALVCSGVPQAPEPPAVVSPPQRHPPSLIVSRTARPPRPAAEVWQRIVEECVDWSPTSITPPWRGRNRFLIALAQSHRVLAPHANALLIREVVPGVTRDPGIHHSTEQLGALQSALATNTDMAKRVRSLYLVTGVGRYGPRFFFQGCADMRAVRDLVALCPHLHHLDVRIVDPGICKGSLSFPEPIPPAPLQQLCIRVHDNLSDVRNSASLCEFALQALSVYRSLHTLLLHLPAVFYSELPVPEPYPWLKELRLAGVPPRAILEAATGLQRLVLVGPAQTEHPEDVRFLNMLYVPPSTRDLVFLGDFAAYSELDLSNAMNIHSITIEWADCKDEEILEKLVARFDYASAELHVSTLRLPLDPLVSAMLYDTLRPSLVQLRRRLGDVRSVVLSQLPGPRLLEERGEVHRIRCKSLKSFSTC